MSGDQKEGWLWDKQAVPGWEYIEVLGGEDKRLAGDCDSDAFSARKSRLRGDRK
jgi:hypothetical protein